MLRAADGETHNRKVLANSEMDMLSLMRVQYTLLNENMERERTDVQCIDYMGRTSGICSNRPLLHGRATTDVSIHKACISEIGTLVLLELLRHVHAASLGCIRASSLCLVAVDHRETTDWIA